MKKKKKKKRKKKKKGKNSKFATQRVNATTKNNENAQKKQSADSPKVPNSQTRTQKKIGNPCAIQANKQYTISKQW